MLQIVYTVTNIGVKNSSCVLLAYLFQCDKK